jgi:sensor histidine kinase regulating citrate/malate metabolism
MKINFSEEHKDKILSYIENYKNISNEEFQIYEKVKSLQKELNELTAKLQSTDSNLQSLRNEEKEYMEELHTIYGDFTLQDLHESIV